jgi:hypothetical protein
VVRGEVIRVEEQGEETEIKAYGGRIAAAALIIVPGKWREEWEVMKAGRSRSYSQPSSTGGREWEVVVCTVGTRNRGK